MKALSKIRYIPLLTSPPLLPPRNEVNRIYIGVISGRLSICRSVRLSDFCPVDSFWTSEAFATQFGMLVRLRVSSVLRKGQCCCPQRQSRVWYAEVVCVLHVVRTAKVWTEYTCALRQEVGYSFNVTVGFESLKKKSNAASHFWIFELPMWKKKKKHGRKKIPLSLSA